MQEIMMANPRSQKHVLFFPVLGGLGSLGFLSRTWRTVDTTLVQLSLSLSLSSSSSSSGPVLSVLLLSLPLFLYLCLAVSLSLSLSLPLCLFTSVFPSLFPYFTCFPTSL